MPVDGLILAAALVVTFLAAIVQGTIGIGLGMLSVPVLLLLDPILAPVPQLIVTFPLTVAMLNGERHAIEWRAVARVAAARIPGIGVGILLVSLADQQLLSVLIAVTVLIAVAVVASGVSVHRNRASELVAGVVSGTTATISSIGGPPLALLYRRDSGPQVRANLAAIFFVGIIMILLARAATGHIVSSDLVVSLWLAPVVAAGYLISRRLHGRVEGRPLRVGILVVSALAALGLLVRTVTG